jgi:hypothetical protein
MAGEQRKTTKKDASQNRLRTWQRTWVEVKGPSTHNSSGEGQPEERGHLRTEFATSSSTYPGDYKTGHQG